MSSHHSNQWPFVLGLVGLPLVLSCAETPEPEPRLTPAAGETPPTLRVRLSPLTRVHSALSNAQCDRQSRCNAVGEGDTFETRGECVGYFDRLGYDELDLAACRQDADERRLASCLDSVENEPCESTNERESMTRACGAAAVCAGAQ